MIVARLRMMVGFFLAVGAMALAVAIAPSSAEAATIGPCSITPGQPSGVQLSPSGVKSSQGTSRVSCSSTTRVDVVVQLWGDDAGGLSYDDLRGTTKHEYRTVYAGRNYTFRSILYNCNEDSPGTDELFSRVYLKIYTANGVYYTPWTQSQTYSPYYC